MAVTMSSAAAAPKQCRRNAGHVNRSNFDAAPLGLPPDESLSLQSHYHQSLPSSISASTAASVHASIPAATASSSNSPVSACSSGSVQQPSSIAYQQYHYQHIDFTQLNGGNDPFPDHYFPSNSITAPLSVEGFIPTQTATSAATTTAPASPWLDFLDVSLDIFDQHDHPLDASLLSTGTGSQSEQECMLSNPLSDAPAPVEISEYDLVHPYSVGDELEVDESLYLNNAQDSFEAPALPRTLYSPPDYHHSSNNLKNDDYIPTSQSIINQDINPTQCHQLTFPSQTQAPTYQLQPKTYSPLTLNSSTSPSPSSTSTLNSASPSTQAGRLTAQATRSPAPKAAATAADLAADKRRRNTLAARRFRQKQQDRVAELERTLERVCKERDELKMQAARWEGEAVALRGMLQKRR
ncbi:hypothetical protein PAAG_00257 [Paracoccidioides lutzii Pb01]|uniref:BZIP domain-containing protein n=1 Tax=Paracoccidioides lutzii (strain ATCC MYA-826 / Pb01) TaxID=502779 RepID=C1GP12_PARBA|nr:hypothetical protein PAAG_00257 [Paracoccidioides lutzii Pb01]EEH35934.1 hypothetical protein PAAG_00257 [Paracoccidioides lutzii Pb01]